MDVLWLQESAKMAQSLKKVAEANAVSTVCPLFPHTWKFMIITIVWWFVAV